MKVAQAKLVGEKQLDPGDVSSCLLLGASLSMEASTVFSARVMGIPVFNVISMGLRSISHPSSFPPQTKKPQTVAVVARDSRGSHVPIINL